MDIVETSFDIAARQAKASGEAFQIVGGCAAAMLETTVAFMRASAERGAAMGASLMSTKTFDAAAELHGDFVRDSMRSTSQLATKLADALTSAAKDCQKLAKISANAALVRPGADRA